MIKIIKLNIFIPIPSNISYMWNFGSLLGLNLILQILTGLFLTIHYHGDLNSAFDRIDQIIRNVNNGWIIRFIHTNGASLFFLLIFIHIGRGLYYKSFFLKRKTWLSGVLILLLLIIIAFIGYVLPWGQISFWGATVITNLLTALPYIGKIITNWIWGGFSVSGATLTRFFRLHFLIPFILLIIILIHLIFLHETGSSNPLGNNSYNDIISFHPFFSWKDIYGLIFLMILFIFINLHAPYFFIDPDNFIKANPIVTPPHIQPEWYFLFAYAILRSIPNKLGGVIALFIRILIFLTLKFIFKKRGFFKKKVIFWFFCINFFILTFLGACVVEHPYVQISQICGIIYFILLLIF